MKRQIKKWTLRLTVTGLFVAGLLLLIIVNPILTYANKTTHHNYTIFHNKPLEPTLITKLDQATDLLKESEFYNPKLQLDICLNDGSKYPNIIRAIRGQAFAWGFYDKVVLQGTMNSKDNYVELNGYKWNLVQLLAHEMTHCLQFDKLGFWKSNPIANIDSWKWEGYAEFISRKNSNQHFVAQSIGTLLKTDKGSWCVTLEDSTIAPTEYYNAWNLVQYCIDIKKMTYQQILSQTTKEYAIKQEMMNWYENEK